MKRRFEGLRLHEQLLKFTRSRRRGQRHDGEAGNKHYTTAQGPESRHLGCEGLSVLPSNSRLRPSLASAPRLGLGSSSLPDPISSSELRQHTLSRSIPFLSSHRTKSTQRTPRIRRELPPAPPNVRDDGRQRNTKHKTTSSSSPSTSSSIRVRAHSLIPRSFAHRCTQPRQPERPLSTVVRTGKVTATHQPQRTIEITIIGSNDRERQQPLLSTPIRAGGGGSRNETHIP